MIELTIHDHGQSHTVILCGGIGMRDKPIVFAPTLCEHAGYAVVESACGGRDHQLVGEVDEQLGAIVNETVKAGGNTAMRPVLSAVGPTSWNEAAPRGRIGTPQGPRRKRITMYSMRAITLAALLCLIIGITACQQPRMGKKPASPTEVHQEQESEPQWTLGWSQLRSGMDPVDVLSLLNEPKHVKVTKINTTWYYSDRRADGPHVVFGTRQMRVERWRTTHSR